MKKFLGGYLAGSVVTSALVLGAILGVKKTVIEPVEKKESELEENRKKAARRSFSR